MPDPSPLPSPDGDDPLAGDDPTELRTEILRLRDALLGEQSHSDVLDDRVAELEAQVEQLGADNAALHAELDRSPMTRALRAVARRLGRTP